MTYSCTSQSSYQLLHLNVASLSPCQYCVKHSLTRNIVAPLVPSGMPQNISATYDSPTSARISWQPPLARQRNGVITMYQVRYQDKHNAIDLRADNTSETSLVIEELTAGSQYFIQVVAFTSAGAGPTSHRIVYNTVETSESVYRSKRSAHRIVSQEMLAVFCSGFVFQHNM